MQYQMLEGDKTINFWRLFDQEKMTVLSFSVDHSLQIISHWCSCQGLQVHRSNHRFQGSLHFHILPLRPKSQVRSIQRLPELSCSSWRGRQRTGAGLRRWAKVEDAFLQQQWGGRSSNEMSCRTLLNLMESLHFYTLEAPFHELPSHASRLDAFGLLKSKSTAIFLVLLHLSVNDRRFQSS